MAYSRIAPYETDSRINFIANLETCRLAEGAELGYFRIIGQPAHFSVDANSGKLCPILHTHHTACCHQ